MCLQALAVISAMYVITLNCFDRMARRVAQLHLSPAAFSVQPEITAAVCSWRICSQGDFASRNRGLGVNTQRRSGWLPPIIRQPFHRAFWHGFFFSPLLLLLLTRCFLLRPFKVCTKVQEFSSSSVAVQVLSYKEVGLCPQLLTTQHLQTLWWAVSWITEKLQTSSLDLEQV